MKWMKKSGEEICSKIDFDSKCYSHHLEMVVSVKVLSEIGFSGSWSLFIACGARFCISVCFKLRSLEDQVFRSFISVGWFEKFRNKNWRSYSNSEHFLNSCVLELRVKRAFWCSVHEWRFISVRRVNLCAKAACKGLILARWRRTRYVRVGGLGASFRVITICPNDLGSVHGVNSVSTRISSVFFMPPQLWKPLITSRARQGGWMKHIKYSRT